MSMYAVKNDEGKWLQTDTFGTCYWKDEIYDAERYIEVLYAHHDAKRYGGRVVELVEAPAKVVVNEKEAELLDKFKSGREWAAGLISKYATELFMNDKTNNVVALEDRLMRAYVNGWTVEKPKRYLIYKRLPGAAHVNKIDVVQAMKYEDNSGFMWVFRYADELSKHNQYQFTAAEIEHYGLLDCEKVEVTDDEQ